MKEEEIDLLLPEWVFLEGNSHLGNILEGRDVVEHVPSLTIMEVFLMTEVSLKIDPKIKTKEFYYENSRGELEHHLLVVHICLLKDPDVLDTIIDGTIEFYKNYITWEDKNIEESETSKLN